MRMVCAAYVGKMMGDKAMEARSEVILFLLLLAVIDQTQNGTDIITELS